MAETLTREKILSLSVDDCLSLFPLTWGYEKVNDNLAKVGNINVPLEGEHGLRQIVLQHFVIDDCQPLPAGADIM